MTIVLVVIAGLAVVVIALVAIGGETFRLRNEPRQALFDLEEAVSWVADRLPDEITASISYDDVRSILRWHLEYLRDRGVPDRREGAALARAAIVEDEEGIAYVLGRADDAGIELTDVEVAAVLEVELGYLEAIGAVGRRLPGPPELGPPADRELRGDT